MNREEFVKALCQIIGEFACRETGDSGPCFCGQNDIAALEVKHGTWQGSKALLHSVAHKLGVKWDEEG